MSDVEEDLLVKKLKIVLVGDSGSGKVSFLMFPAFNRKCDPSPKRQCTFSSLLFLR